MYAHVRWEEGPKRGEVGLYPIEDLRPVSGTVSPSLSAFHASQTSLDALLDDSLEVGIAPSSSLTYVASAEAVYDERGPQGLVEHLSSTGHLASYAQVIEDVVQQVVAQLQHDAVLHQLTALMDAEEAEAVYRTAALTLLKDLED
jgi:hypothetical protein